MPSAVWSGIYATLAGTAYHTFAGAPDAVVCIGCFPFIRILSAPTNSQVGFASRIIVPPESRTVMPFASIVT